MDSNVNSSPYFLPEQYDHVQQSKTEAPWMGLDTPRASSDPTMIASSSRAELDNNLGLERWWSYYKDYYKNYPPQNYATPNSDLMEIQSGPGPYHTRFTLPGETQMQFGNTGDEWFQSTTDGVTMRSPSPTASSVFGSLPPLTDGGTLSELSTPDHSLVKPKKTTRSGCNQSFLCICGRTYARKAYFRKHIIICQKDPTKSSFSCHCKRTFDVLSKHSLIQHLDECGSTAPQKCLPQPTSPRVVDTPEVTSSVALENESRPGLLTQNKEPGVVLDQATPLALTTENPPNWTYPSNGSKVAGDGNNTHVPPSSPSKEPDSNTAERSTRDWLRGLRVIEIPHDKEIQVSSSSPGASPKHSSVCSRQESITEEELSVATDSDLLSISEASDLEFPIEIKPPSPLQKHLVNHVLHDYDNVRRGQGGVGYATPAPTTSSGSTSNRSSKRKSGDVDSVDDSSSGPTPKATKRPREDGVRPRVLACPFWKHDSEKHRRCCKLTLTRIRDVKQHLHRRHTPYFYCDRCYEVFEDGDGYQRHFLRDMVCSRGPDSQLEGINRIQNLALTKKSDRNQGEEDQWFAIWDIIFPGVTRPVSAYVDSELTEEMSSFREYWTNRGHDVLMRELDSCDVWSLSATERDFQARQVLARGLANIYEQWASTRSVTLATPTDSLNSASPHRTPSRTSGTSGTSAQPPDLPTTTTPLVPATPDQRVNIVAVTRHEGDWPLNPQPDSEVLLRTATDSIRTTLPHHGEPVPEQPDQMGLNQAGDFDFPELTAAGIDYGAGLDMEFDFSQLENLIPVGEPDIGS
ncbi:hypothetical protein F4778DRAFT_714758 [Xylariomycetidae sp. FL2044]|nr:hypothetical protein F4778DRAFT_714758 [Xylariomycetidae sp. FL2044]